MGTTAARWTLVCAVLLAPLSGCAVGNPSYNGGIRFVGEMGIEEGTFEMDGEITNSGMERFGDVRVSLYFSNGTAFHSVRGGDLNRELQVAISSPTIPEYVVIHSPDFWDTPRVQVDYYVRTGSEGYESETASGRDGVPVELG